MRRCARWWEACHGPLAEPVSFVPWEVLLLYLVSTRFEVQAPSRIAFTIAHATQQRNRPQLSPAALGKTCQIDLRSPKDARYEPGRLADLLHNALIRPISARYPAGLSLRASERILVKRLESRSRQCRGGPSGRDLRNISMAC